MSVASNKSTSSSDLSVKLNQLEDKVAKLTDQIKANKQTISELKLAVAQRASQIHEMELKLGYAQRSLLEKATHKIEECRNQIKTGMDERVISPTIKQIQHHIKTTQDFLDEAKAILFHKKALVDNTILTTKDKVVQCPDLAKAYVEKSIIAPAQTALKQMLETLSAQAKTTHNLVEDKAIYPSKVLLDEVVSTVQNLPDKINSLLQVQVIKPLTEASKKASTTASTIYPDTLDYLSKPTSRFADIFNQAMIEITGRIKQSPFWDGKNKAKVTF
jgi:hypothetical protein